MNNILPVLARISKFVDLSQDEFAHLAGMAMPPRVVEARTILVEEGASCDHCHLVIDGWVGSFTTSRNGKRSLNRVHMSGDLAGTDNLAFETSCESLVTLNAAVIATVPFATVGSLFEQKYRLSRVLYLIALEERVRIIDRNAAMLRSDALGRVAYVLLDLADRHAAANAAPSDSFPFPLNQSDLADLTGLTPTHVNRTLKRLRADEVIDVRSRTVIIHDREDLERLADRPRRNPAPPTG